MNVEEHLQTRPVKKFKATGFLKNRDEEITFCPEAFLYDPKLVQKFGHWEIISTDEP